MPNQLLALLRNHDQHSLGANRHPKSTFLRSSRWAPWLAASLLGALGATAQAQDIPDILVNHDGLIAGEQGTSGPAGGAFTYRAKVKLNTGPTATGVVLTQVLPVGAIFRSISTQPSGISCAPSLAADTVITSANQTFTCQVGSVTSDFKWVDFNVVLPTVGSTWKAVTSASLPQPYGTNDADGGLNNINLERNFTASVATDFGVRLTSPASATGVNNGELYNYTIDVTSYGPEALPAGGFARVTFELPSGAPLDGAITTNGWTCTPSSGALLTGLVTCDFANPTSPTAGTYFSGSALPSIIVPVRSQMGGPIGAAVSVEGFDAPGVPRADGRKTNNTASLIVQSTGGDYTDVSLSKTVDKPLLDTSDAANAVTYTLAVERKGGALQPEQVVVTDTLPVGVNFAAFVAGNDPRWNCSRALQVITCNWDTGAPYTGANNSAFPSIKFTATVPGQAAGTSLTNNAVVSVKPGTEPNTANNKSSAEVVFSNRAQLAVSKSGPQRPVKKGEQFPYTIVVTNNGPMPIAAGTPISVTDTPSANLRLMGMGAGGAAGWACPGLPEAAGIASTCTINSALPVGSSLTLVLLAQVDTLTGEYAQFTNAVTTGPLPGRDGETVSAQAAVTVSELSGDLVLSKVIQTPASPAKSGNPVTYRLTVTNKAGSTQTAQQVKITDVLKNLVIAGDGDGNTGATGRFPNGGFVSAVVSSPMPTYPAATDNSYLAGTTSVACPVPSGDKSSTERTLICTADYLAPGASVSVDVTIIPRVATATPTATTPMDYKNEASAYSSFINDPTPADNVADVTYQMTPLVDLTVKKQVSPTNEVAAGQPATYTVTTQNLGPSSAQSVRMVDTLPPNAILVGEPTAPGATCTHSAGAGNMNGRQGGTMTCEWTTDLARGAQYVVTYKARSVGGDPVGGAYSCITGATRTEARMDNCVVVSTATEETDLTNNTANATIALKPAVVDMQIQMRHSDDGLVLGGTTEYTLTVTNDANSDSYATNVNISEMFPAAGSTATFSYQGGLTVTGVSGGVRTGYVSGVTSGISAALCTTVPAVGATSGPLGCVIPLMAPGDSIVIKFTLKADALPAGAKTGTVFHTATVKPAETEYMPGYDALANNSTTDRTSTSSTAQAVDYGVTKTGPSSMFLPGDTVTYTITVNNWGQTVPAPPATMTDALPAGLLFTSMTTPAGATCTTPAVGTNGTVSCNIPTLAKGASLVFTITAEIEKPYTGAYPLVNKATVSAPGDTNPDNDESTTTTTTPPPPTPTGIPTLSQWGLILLSLLMAAFALRQGAAQRRK
jgi:uncharacterized repeat protein (TIGR01451 family)